MKKLSFLLLAVFLYASALAQTVTIRFEGTASSAKDYAVDLDQRKYYSSSADVAGANGVKQLVIDDLALGSHKLAVYEITENSTVAGNSANTLLYSNSFQLRTGYDMVIAVRRNGTVTFTERKVKATVSDATAPAMADTEFSKLLKSVKDKWSQSTRFTAIKTAFANKAYFFNTDQVGELLLLITSEPKRLELAKLSYAKVVDPTNFADVADLFNTQANKDNILAFVQTKTPDVVTTTGVKPLTTQQFNQLLRQVRNQYDQAGKYAVLNDALSVSTNNFTTAQLRQLLALITTETNRLALAKLSYARVTDAANFTSLYDLFTTQASRDELNNYVKYGGSIGTTGQYASRIAMSDADFSKLHVKARLHLRQSSTVSDVRAALTNKSNYFTVDQTRSLLTLISLESERLALAKLAYHRAADPTSFNLLYDIFTSQASIDDLNNYIKSNPS